MAQQRGSKSEAPENNGNINQREKITIYLDSDQVNKLTRLELEYNERTGKRINRNEIIRRLIKWCTVELLIELLKNR